MGHLTQVRASRSCARADSHTDSALFGLLTDNNLKGSDFALLTTIFYMGYLLAEWPVVWLMQRYRCGTVAFAVLKTSLTHRRTAPALS